MAKNPYYAAGAIEYWKSAVDARIPQALADHGLSGSESCRAHLSEQALDEEIAAITTILRSVKALRNARLPETRRLPPELLARIFSFATVVDPPKRVPAKEHASLPTRPVRFSLGWIVVTHVCRHWREIALADASLWSNLDGFNLTRRWLERFASISSSARTPLSVVVDPMTPRTAIPSVFDVALLPTANARLRSVALIHEPGDTRSCQDTDIITTLSEGERGPAPLLESLTVTHEPELEPRNVYLPPCFLASDAPCLQSLVLQRCAISWESPLLRNLAHLSITLLRTSQFRGRRLPDGHNLSKRQLYDVLRNMPSLETVILKHALGGVSKTHGVFPDSIRFPRLISLSIADKLSNCVCLMGMVSIPPSTLCNLDIANFDLKPGFLPSLSQLGADAFPIRSLSFGEPRKPSEKFNICCWSAQQNWCSPTPRGDQPRWKLNTPVYNLNPSEMTKMGRLCLDELQEAWLDFTEAVAIYLWNTRDWAAVFERAPHVRSILVTAPDGADMNQFLRALDAPTPQTLLFPELRCLVFREIDRQEGTVDSLDVEDSDDDELSWMDTFVNPLVSCLSARLERGNTLDLLQLPEKYQGQAWIGRVEGVVSKLVFGPDIARRE